MRRAPPEANVDGVMSYAFHYDAVLFDLDGVLTSTAALHARCWKKVFDDVLLVVALTTGIRQAPFDAHADYLAHVDGKPRADGVRDFVASRAIDLPEGSPDDRAGEWSVHGIGNLKQALVERAIERDGVQAFPGSVVCARTLRYRGVRTAVVSSSANCDDVLRAAGIDHLFDVTVDGRDVMELGLEGKPAPDGFLEAARRLGVSPDRAAVVEDAIAGVEAGRAGGFAAVVGVDRNGSSAALAQAGADIVVRDLEELVS
jgi:alpha,alpha-trehalose phosphorylase